MSDLLDALVADSLRLIDIESPSDDLAAVGVCADAVAALGERLLGVAPERLEREGVPHLRWRLGDGPRRVVLLGHVDTVWPHGSLARLGSGVCDGVLRGPGCFDMKVGLVMALHALAIVRGHGGDLDGVSVLATGDEEVGSPTSRALIEDEARGARAALVFEAAAGPDGLLKTGRKGTSNYEVRITGHASHAGLDPEKGVNAALEMAAQLQAVAAISDPAQGTTVTPTIARAGEVSNTVPPHGSIVVDGRTETLAEQERVDAAFAALTPVLDGARVEVVGGPNRPPMEQSAGAALHAELAAAAGDLGLPAPGHVAVGGASDGNFTAAIGTPTLDGLGAVGDGAHADHEHVVLGGLDDRVRVVARLVERLLG